MFRIFRNLRNEKVLQRSKSYFLYAIGEIILVVIGILIALYLNTQKEEFKERQNEIILLKKLKEENLYNIDVLEDNNNEKYHEEIPKIFNRFVNYLTYNRIDSLTDSLAYFMNETMRTPLYTFSDGNLNNYIISQKNNFPEINKEVIFLKNLQDDLHLFSDKGVAIKLEDYYKKLNNEIDYYTGEIYSTKAINSIGFRNNMYLMQSMEQELSKIYSLTLSQMRKVDSLLTIALEEDR